MSYDKITNILITILIILVSISIFMQFKQMDIIDIKIKSAINEVSKNIKVPDDGYTPVKGIDYVDGKDGVNGRNGKDSLSTHILEKETVIKEVPVNGKDGIDGKTPILRCNDKKNRWEVSYNLDTMWTILRDTNNNPVKCIIE